MFDSPILFGLLISLIATIVFFFINKEQDKKDKDPSKNTKYLVMFGIIFILTLIGKIYYNGDLNNIEENILNNIEVLPRINQPLSSNEVPPF